MKGCGCSTHYDVDSVGYPHHYIDYCPLHSQARELLRMLKNYVLHDVTDSEERKDAISLIAKAEAAQ